MKTPTLTGSAVTKLSTKELSQKTWPDFVKLFSQGNGWDHCCCVHFHRPRPLPKDQWLPTRKLRAARNRREQRKLIEKGCSHGILVYANGVPVGWCQYGPKDELTRIDNGRTYRVPGRNQSGKILAHHLFCRGQKLSSPRHRDRRAEGRSRIHKTTRWRDGGGLPGGELGGQVVWEYVHSRHGVDVQEARVQARRGVWQYQCADAKNDLNCQHRWMAKEWLPNFRLEPRNILESR